MYRILIVDDEFLVRLGLKTTINWEENGYQVVGEASNGKEALDMMQKFSPDIVLADIKMPLMDGLEFITEAKQINPKTSFIILSNYESFQYAQKAVKLGVSRYILKAEISPETLLNALEDIKKEKKLKEAEISDNSQERISYFRKQLSTGQINQINPLERMKSPEEGIFPSYLCRVAKYYCNICTLSDSSLDMLSKTTISLLEAEFSEVIYHEVIFQMHYYITFLYYEKSFKGSFEYLLEKTQLIQRKLEYYFGVKLQGGISTARYSNEMPILFREAEEARQDCFFKEGGFLSYRKKEQNSSVEEKKQINSVSITNMLDEKQKEKLKQYIHDIFGELRKKNNYGEVKHYFIELLFLAKSNIERKNIAVQDAFLAKLNYENWNKLTSLEEAESYIWDIFEPMFLEDAEEAGYSMSVRQSISYIEEHYESNITLEEVAIYVDISKSYLSMLFKQETGINFVAYLNRYRVEKAKKLLCTTNYKIYEIASMVGFYSPYYFSKVFKEVTKMQCKEYRDMHFRSE